MDLKEILKEQMREFDKELENQVGVDNEFGSHIYHLTRAKWLEETRERFKKFIKEFNAKIIKAVSEEMTGKEIFTKLLTTERALGYNDRILEEQLKAQSIINETKI